MHVSDRENAGFETSSETDASYSDSLKRREEHVRSEFWDKFRSVAGRIPFADDLVAAYYCAMDPETPLKVRGTLLGALAYFILPLDLLPDMIVSLGFTDDAAVLLAAIRAVASSIEPAHYAKAEETLRDPKGSEPDDDLAARAPGGEMG